MIKKLFILLLVINISGCAAAVMKKWIGSSKDQVIQQWGVPDRSVKLDNGKQVLTWDGRNGYGQIICTQSFTINTDGNIEDFSTNCP
jgi:hypothetical protein